MSVSELQNSAVMWVACGIPVVLVLAQAIIFARKAYQAGPKLGLTQKQMKAGMRSSAITSLGPSVVILSGMLSLLVTMGGPVAWMRLSLIGSVMFESLAAGFGTASVGVELGSTGMTELAYTMGLWTMILCSIGWVIFATLTADQMEKVQKKVTGSNPALLTALSSAAVIGAFSSFCAQNIVKVNKNTIAVILGGLIMFVMMKICETKQIKWLRDWALTFAILGSMIITALLPV
ncbi:MAG: DUF5058 family protein [Lachnospiraceae bacterium]|nr:DUF5058 family protein [Lachnospiraceae bacterium]